MSSAVSVHWGHRIMENRAQSSACKGTGHCVKFFSSLWPEMSQRTPERKRLSHPRPCLHPSVCGERTGAGYSLCVYMCSSEHAAVHRALFVPLLLGLLMKESNWIFLGVGAQ